MARQGRCAHPECRCSVEAAQAVSQGGRRYCSEDCATGTGCRHPDCNCAGGAPRAE
jgi:hypothetical protein